MIALCVDDERLPLEALERAVKKSDDITEVFSFEDELAALDWAKTHPVDVAFVDIELNKMNGIDFAKELVKVRPALSVVFCTSYEQYALRAIQLHMDVGYLVKPFRPAQVQAEIDHIKERGSSSSMLQANCFGNFEVFVNHVPIQFRRTKTKEMLAYLIDRRGAEVGVDELLSVLWEDDLEVKKKRDYLYHLVADLRNSLNREGVGDVLLSKSAGYCVDTELIDCDYYKYLNGEDGAVRTYVGEYMRQYSWAEVTNAWIARQQIN